LYVSRGNQVQMPNLLNLSADDARRELKRSGFDGDIRFSQQDTDNPSQNGVVIGQSVRPRDGVDPDGSVGVTVGRYRGSNNSSPSGRSSSSSPSSPSSGIPGGGLLGN
jgi:beta-lactam-binding protein with PASTA domain